jgi:hypothetical protein
MKLYHDHNRKHSKRIKTYGIHHLTSGECSSINSNVHLLRTAFESGMICTSAIPATRKADTEES